MQGMNQFLKLVARNALRHRLRMSLTLAGLVVAILSFGLLQTIISTWHAGIDHAVPSRLIIRNAVSLSLPLPVAYQKRIRSIEGVRSVTYVSWFGGIYKNEKNFFPQFAVDAKSYLEVHPEIRLSDEARSTFLRDRRGAIVGRNIANHFGFEAGDVIQLRSMIYPGSWEFVISGIFDFSDPNIDTSQFLFHWNYLNETLRLRSRSQADQVNFFMVDVGALDRIANVSQAIDGMFRNSAAETHTETQRAFQISFVKQTEAILLSVRTISFVVIFIILAVMANTMAMTARERLVEYATLKAIGFGPGYVGWLILGESIVVALAGGAVAIMLTPPAAAYFGVFNSALFPSLNVSSSTMALQGAVALLVGVLAALVPMQRVASVRIVDGLRAVG